MKKLCPLRKIIEVTAWNGEATYPPGAPVKYEEIFRRCMGNKCAWWLEEQKICAVALRKTEEQPFREK